MERTLPTLAGQRGLRGDILVELKKTQPLTAKELGDRFRVSANAVRRHLKELEAEGLVVYGREQRGNGAPTYAYRLSPNGEALFPKQYEDALMLLLNHIVRNEGRDAAVSVLEQQYFDLRRKLGADLDDLDPADRVRAVAGVLEDAGFMAECEEADGELRLTIHNCAIHAAASCLPEVCQTEVSFLEKAMAAQTERRSHIMDGCNACQYVVKFDSPAEPAA
jgi:DeoR family suf operon transcriptional repressor